jgi:hypothetical protein
MNECPGCSLCCTRCGMEQYSDQYENLPIEQWPPHECGEAAKESV